MLANTPILKYVAGGNKNSTNLIIDLENVDASECLLHAGFDNTKDNSISHVDNTFNIKHLPTGAVQSDLFVSITPVRVLDKKEKKLEL